MSATPVSEVKVSEQVKALAKDLTKEPPRSPRETLGGYILAARALDKCRAMLNGTLGEYYFNRYLDNVFFSFAGIDAEAFQNFVATGASDEAVGKWIQQHAKQTDRLEVVHWNNHLRYATLKELDADMQLFMEDYIAANVPQHRPVYHVFDVFDLEEGRL